MSRARTRPAVDGDLVRTLTAAQASEFKAPRGGTPVAGTTVHLWHLDGTWSVWSAGPETGTWWVKPVDIAARDLVAALTVNPARGWPTAIRVAQGCLAVKSKEIRAGGR